MPIFKTPDQLKRHLKKAADALQAEIIITVQSELGSTRVSPYDTGRFRSSWFASEGRQSDNIAPDGADAPNMDATGLKVDSDKNYYLTNSLEYAQSVAIEGRVVSQPQTWFKDFRDSRIPKIQAAAESVIKRSYEL